MCWRVFDGPRSSPCGYVELSRLGWSDARVPTHPRGTHRAESLTLEQLRSHWRNASGGKRVLCILLGILLIILITSKYGSSVAERDGARVEVVAEWVAFDRLCKTRLPEEYRKRADELRGSKADAAKREYEKLVGRLKQDETRLEEFCATWTARFFQLTLDPGRPTHSAIAGQRRD